MTVGEPQSKASAQVGVSIQEMKKDLLELYGPLVGGEALRRAMGFRSAASFERAVRNQQTSLTIFGLEGRRGKFAYTSELAKWLVEQGKRKGNQSAVR